MTELDAERLNRSDVNRAGLVDFAVKSHTHLWVVLTSHRAGDALLDVLDGVTEDGQVMLDAESLLGSPKIGCYVCEQPYSPRLRLRRCPGEPRVPGVGGLLR